MKIAIVPARGGSKRIPRKNIREFCGRPMIEWPIGSARQAGCFDRILVSTDDDEVAAIARAAGAEVPFVRPAELSDDHTGTAAVVAHAVRWSLSNGIAPSAVCCLYPTAAFVTPDDILRGLRELGSSGADFAVSVTSFGFPIQRAVRVNANGRLAMFQPEHLNTRSQDLEPAFHDAAQFYWGRADAWLSGAALFSNASVAVPIPRHRVQDIDTPEDWERAQWMFKALRAAQP